MSNNISQTFINDIKQWVTLDDQLKQTSKLVKQIKKKKNEVGLEIQGYMEQNEIQDKDINLSDGKIKYYVSKRTCGMSKKYIENSLMLYYNGDLTKAREVTNYIYANRESKEATTLKRVKNRGQTKNT
mgnify:FL=1